MTADLDALEELLGRATACPWPEPELRVGKEWWDIGDLARVVDYDDAVAIVVLRNAASGLIAEVRALKAALQDAKALLDGARPAWTNLTTNQRQLDMDGCEVGVSRQAVDETVDAVLHASDRLLTALTQQEQPHE